MLAGYWTTTYWAEDYWHQNYWPKYGVVAALVAQWLRLAGAIQPVSGEPVWGEPHSHYAILENSDPGETAEQSTDVSSEVPAGTKGIFGRMTARSIGVEDSLLILDGTGGDIVSMIFTSVANIYCKSQFVCPLDSDRKMYWYIDNNDINYIDIIMAGYFS